MRTVELSFNKFEIDFTYEKRKFDSIIYKSSGGKRVYFSACKDGLKYTTIAKQMLFDEENNVYVSFNKTKLIIGSYKDVS